MPGAALLLGLLVAASLPANGAKPSQKDSLLASSAKAVTNRALQGMPPSARRRLVRMLKTLFPVENKNAKLGGVLEKIVQSVPLETTTFETADLQDPTSLRKMRFARLTAGPLQIISELEPNGEAWIPVREHIQFDEKDHTVLLSNDSLTIRRPDRIDVAKYDGPLTISSTIHKKPPKEQGWSRKFKAQFGNIQIPGYEGDPSPENNLILRKFNADLSALLEYNGPTTPRAEAKAAKILARIRSLLEGVGLPMVLGDGKAEMLAFKDGTVLTRTFTLGDGAATDLGLIKDGVVDNITMKTGSQAHPSFEETAKRMFQHPIFDKASLNPSLNDVVSIGRQRPSAKRKDGVHVYTVGPSILIGSRKSD